MEKILFPTDFSEQNPIALQYALELAKHFKATLIPMHVYDLSEEATSPKKDKQQIADYMMDVLADFISKNKSKQYDEVPVKHIVDVGMPGREIVDVALDEDIGLIVLGMTGKNNAGGRLFGSTSTEVIGKADCPVLAIPASPTYVKPEQLAFMTDFHFRDIGVINSLREWANHFDVKVHCLHIVGKNKSDLDAAVNMSMLGDAFKSPQMPKFEVLKGDLVEKMNQYMNEENIGIVAMLSRKRGFVESMLESSKTKKVAKIIERPILVFKENAYKPILFPVDFSGFSIA